MVRLIGFSIFVVSFYAFANSECDTAKPLGFIVACYEGKLKAADAHLNDSYRNLKSALKLSGYDNQSKESYWSFFVESQRYWIKLRDEQCKAKQAFFENDSYAQVIEKNKCLIDATNTRSRLLENEVEFIQNLP